MRIFDFLSTLNPNLDPAETKLHLATPDEDGDDPLDLYHSGEFEEWQRWQRKRNFNREFVLALIRLPNPDQWLFAGVYHSGDAEWLEDDEYYYYELTEDQHCKEMSGQIVVEFRRPGRQAYLKAEKWSDQIFIIDTEAEQAGQTAAEI